MGRDTKRRHHGSASGPAHLWWGGPGERWDATIWDPVSGMAPDLGAFILHVVFSVLVALPAIVAQWVVAVSTVPRHVIQFLEMVPRLLVGLATLLLGRALLD